MSRRFQVKQAILACMSIALSACGSGDKDFRVIASIDSHGQTITFEFAPSQLAFGPADIRVSTGESDATVVRYESQISNDGGEITLDNLRPNSSKPGHLWLCLNGVEQADVVVRIDFGANLVIEAQRPCAD